jgi:threonine aldolase
MRQRNLIDLVSDTSTRPSRAMREAMANAEVGDEQLGEDPSTNALQERVAALLGKEAAVFLPSGTLCNQIAMLVHCRPGDEVIGADNSHIFTSEAGGGSALAGVQTWPLPSKRGVFTSAAVEAAIRPATRHSPRTRLVVIEQTNNKAGGAIWPRAAIEEVAAAARKHGLGVHMDGARILNASIAAGVPAAAFARPCDSVWLDLSKGLGCPVGGVLAGSKTFIDEAWRWKHRLGAAMRQSGILAAAGLYALDHNVERLAEDHANARRFAELAAKLPGLRLDPPEVDTNIVFLDCSATGLPARALNDLLIARGVRLNVAAPMRLRAVTHLDVARTHVEAAARELAEVLEAKVKPGRHKTGAQ